MRLNVLVLAHLLICLLPCIDASDYREHLVLRPLPQSALLAAFDFTSNTTIAAFEEQTYNLFPRSLGQILQHAHTKELHLRFALGRWDAANWGARPRGGRSEGGTGVEMWAWLEADTEEEANARWSTLTNALSGLFCASMNFIDSTRTIRPMSTFQFQGTPSQPAEKLHHLHGALPHEVVCTENLTPFLKLLPCKGKAGISSLLDGHKLFDASWQTMAIDIRPICPEDGSECLLQIEQTVDMVLDIDRSLRPSNDPIPRPPPLEQIACNTSKSYHSEDTCFPMVRTGEPAWTLEGVFGRRIQGSCELGERDGVTVELHVPDDRDVSSNATRAGDGGTGSRFFRLSPENDLNLDVKEYASTPSVALDQPRLYAERTFTGHGSEKGGMHTVLTNPSSTEPVDLVFLESLPWFMKTYLHTLRAAVTPISSLTTNTTASASTDPITSILYRPGIDRHRGTHLELRITVPPASVVTLGYDFEKAILRYTEYPPDANRGFDVAPAIIRLLPSREHSADDGAKAFAPSTYMRTTSLLLPLPTPDFSMPYNVIILTSTVIAMGFGSVFNLLVRRFVGADEVEGMDVRAIREKVFTRLRAVAERVGIRMDKGHDIALKKTQ